MVTKKGLFVVIIMGLFISFVQAKEFWQFKKTPGGIAPQDLILVKRPVTTGYGNNTGIYDITGANIRASMKNSTSQIGNVSGLTAALAAKQNTLNTYSCPSGYALTNVNSTSFVCRAASGGSVDLTPYYRITAHSQYSSNRAAELAANKAAQNAKFNSQSATNQAKLNQKENTGIATSLISSHNVSGSAHSGQFIGKQDRLAKQSCPTGKVFKSYSGGVFKCVSSSTSGGGGTSDHSALTNRLIPNQHNIASITGVAEAFTHYSSGLSNLAAIPVFATHSTATLVPDSINYLWGNIPRAVKFPLPPTDKNFHMVTLVSGYNGNALSFANLSTSAAKPFAIGLSWFTKYRFPLPPGSSIRFISYSGAWRGERKDAAGTAVNAASHVTTLTDDGIELDNSLVTPAVNTDTITPGALNVHAITYLSTGVTTNIGVYVPSTYVRGTPIKWAIFLHGHGGLWNNFLDPSDPMGIGNAGSPAPYTTWYAAAEAAGMIIVGVNGALSPGVATDFSQWLRTPWLNNKALEEAAAFIKRKYQLYDYLPSIYGHSMGGWKVLYELGNNSDRYSAYGASAAPSDLALYMSSDRRMDPYFGQGGPYPTGDAVKDAAWYKASPLKWIDTIGLSARKLWMAIGSSDATVDPTTQFTALKTKLPAFNRYTSHLVPGVGHISQGERYATELMTFFSNEARLAAKTDGITKGNGTEMAGFQVAIPKNIAVIPQNPTVGAFMRVNAQGTNLDNTTLIQLPNSNVLDMRGTATVRSGIQINDTDAATDQKKFQIIQGADRNIYFRTIGDGAIASNVFLARRQTSSYLIDHIDIGSSLMIGAEGSITAGMTLDIRGNLNYTGTLYQNGSPLTLGTGTVTSVTSANSDITVATTTTTPVITLNSGSGANQIPKISASGILVNVNIDLGVGN